MSINPYKKRSKIEIIKDVLEVIKDDQYIGPTKLMRKSNLSFQMFQDYIDELLEKRFIDIKKYKNRRNIYFLTSKGYNFLNKFDDFLEFLNEFGF